MEPSIYIIRSILQGCLVKLDHATQECLVQNGVLNRAVSEAAGKGVPGLALDDAVDSQVVFEFSTGVLLILRFEVCINKCSAGSENVVTS